MKNLALLAAHLVLSKALPLSSLRVSAPSSQKTCTHTGSWGLAGHVPRQAALGLRLMEKGRVQSVTAALVLYPEPYPEALISSSVLVVRCDQAELVATAGLETERWRTCRLRS